MFAITVLKRCVRTGVFAPDTHQHSIDFPMFIERTYLWGSRYLTSRESKDVRSIQDQLCHSVIVVKHCVELLVGGVGLLGSISGSNQLQSRSNFGNGFALDAMDNRGAAP